MSIYAAIKNTSNVKIYPSPFFSLSEFYLPDKIKELFKWCSYFYYKDPVVGAAVNKLATYPITPLVISDYENDPKIVDRWNELLNKKLSLRSILIDLGLDYFVYGNAFISWNVAFSRTLRCEECGTSHVISENTSMDSRWKLNFKDKKNPKFEFVCPKCGKTNHVLPIDIPKTTEEGIGFIRWDPNKIDIEYNPITGKSRYFYTIPEDIVTKVKDNKDKQFIKTLPMIYIKAASMGAKVELNKASLFHFKRSTLAGKDQGWGKPLIIHSLQRLFYLYTLRRAQEAIALEHLVPFDIFYPAANASVNPYTDINLSDWKEDLKQELKQHSRDPNYKPILSLPIGHERVGGDGRTLLLVPEIDTGNKEVAAGMGVPLEFIFGGLTWSGSSISLRMLENMFFNYREGIQRLIDFVVENVAATLNLPKVEVNLANLRMADDIQKLQLAMQLNAANKLSDQQLLSEGGWDLFGEYEKIKSEMNLRNEITAEMMKSNAESEGQAGVVSAVYQALAQATNQKILNKQLPEVLESLPFLQRQSQALNDILNYLQLKLNYDQVTLPTKHPELLQQMGPPPGPEGAGGPPPEQGGSPGGPPPEQGGGVPAEKQASNQIKNPNTMTQEEMGQQPFEPYQIDKKQYDNPFFQPQAGPDSERIAKNWATKISRMDTAARMHALSDIQKKSPAMHQKIVGYMATIPPGGTTQQAGQLLKPLPENRPPRRKNSPV